MIPKIKIDKKAKAMYIKLGEGETMNTIYLNNVGHIPSVSVDCLKDGRIIGVKVLW